MNRIQVNFNEVVGPVKAMHGVNCAPYARKTGPNQPAIEKFFTEAKLPYCRLHDCCGAYGGMNFVDIPNIFKDFDADENDPANYDFYFTDEYIGAIQKTGCEAYYRLGITIEWGSKKYFTAPPKDAAKWARICEHVIRHYNEGWADGFHYNLQYWEIWNEPENHGDEFGKCMFDGTPEEFYHLYEVTAKHLKKCFPNIKVGGYGSCGFYAYTNPNKKPPYHMFLTYFTDFLQMVKDTGSPMDFFSWHIYSGSVEELMAHAKYCRDMLDAYGFTDTEAHLNEWNVNAEGGGFPEKHTMVGGSFNAAVFCQLQETRYVDKAMYYCFHTSTYNGLSHPVTGDPEPSWYPFVAYGHLYTLGSSVKTTMQGGVCATAAKNDAEGAVLLANYHHDDENVTLAVSGLGGKKTAHIQMITEDKHLYEEIAFTVCGETELKLRLPRDTVALVKFD